ncbi:MAG: transposase [Clostridium sp.]
MNFYHNINTIPLNIDALNIDKLLCKRENNISTCPHCKSSLYIKHGYYNNLQRFKCRNILCNKTFSAATKSPWSYTKKSFTLWKEYFKLMVENKTLAECSQTLKINLKTAFYWRHKILSAMKSYFKTGELQDFLEINKISFKENFKGSKNITTSLRKPIWIVSAVDIHKIIVSDIVSVGTINVPIIRGSIYKKISKDTYMLPSNDSHLKAISKIHNKNLTTNLPKDKELVRSYSKFLSPWFFRFKGIATKYLNSYLTWYIIFYKNYYNNFEVFIESLTLENSFTRYKDFKSYKLTFT